MTNTPTFHEEILEHLRDGVYFVDLERRITYWNQGAEQISGHKKGKVVGSLCKENILMHENCDGEMICESECPLAKTMFDGQPRELEIFMRHSAGYRVPVHVRATPLYDNEKNIIGAVEIFSENTTRLGNNATLDKLKQLALDDHLTGIGNRRFLEISLASSLNKLQTTGELFGVIFIDVDYFKNVNDGHGHTMGDLALKSIAKTMLAGSRGLDVVGRWGGDEFMLIANNIDAPVLTEIAKRIHAKVEKECCLDMRDKFQISVSVGATMAHTDDSIESLFKRVDKLLYQVKSSGRNNVLVDN